MQGFRAAHATAHGWWLAGLIISIGSLGLVGSIAGCDGGSILTASAGDAPDATAATDAASGDSGPADASAASPDLALGGLDMRPPIDASVAPDLGIFPMHGDDLVEDRSVYAQDDISQVPTIRLTVSDLVGLAQVDANQAGAQVPVLFQEGNFDAGMVMANGMLKLRGNTSRLTTQKSYKIKLFSKTDLWRGQRAINLLKNPYDLTRTRDFVSFELFKTVPHITSLRHQFVHLLVNGNDLGMYEWYEEADERFLESHGLDPLGILYKIDRFTFNPLVQDSFTNPDADPSLESEGLTTDPAKLSAMIADVNDPNMDIDAVIAAHFDRDNYETWLALNILLSNWDTVNRNFYFYSPTWSNRWYFLPWDYNGALSYWESPGNPPRPRTFVAPGNWWGVSLHKRYLMKPANVASLDARIRALFAGPVTDAAAQKILDGAHAIVRGFVQQSPDLDYLPVTMDANTPAKALAEFEGEYQRMRTVISGDFNEYVKAVQWPMPLWLSAPVAMGNSLYYEWDPSYDLQGDKLTYDLLISKTPAFANADLVTQKLGLAATNILLPPPPAGTYYLRVIARDGADPANHWQIPFDEWEDPKTDTDYAGVQQFTVN